jgi:hypothetical protein
MALSDDDLEKIRLIVVEAMATKLELTLGVDCFDAKTREQLRTDLKFLRALRETAIAGTERLFLWALGLAATIVLWAWWPEIRDHWK